MRSYVCGQCHMEYYFSKENKCLALPWSKGPGAENILAYYNEIEFSNWTHKRTGAPMLKAQQPEFEMWLQGKHRRAGVACADCDMPKQAGGGVTYSDHQIRSPLLQVDKACVTCHGGEEKDILEMAESKQEQIHDIQTQALRSIVDTIEHFEGLV